MSTNRVDDLEQLGRCCFDSGQAGRENPRFRFVRRSFIQRRMSVDLLLNADIQYLTRLHDDEGHNRNPEQRFHGWYVFPVEAVRLNGGEIEPDPTPSNTWHANVISPDPAEGADALDHFFGKIAAKAHWRERSIGPSLEEFLDHISRDLDE